MPRDINAEIYEQEVLKSDVPVLVDFWGPQCGPCLALLPAVENLAGELGERVKIVKVDASKNRRLCMSLKVMGLPTFLVYKGGEEIDRLKGANLTISEIEASLKKALD